MIEKAIAAGAKVAILYPGMAMACVGLLILLLKMWKTKSKATNYHIKNFWKYPDDFIVTGGAGVMFLVGIGTFLWRMLS